MPTISIMSWVMFWVCDAFIFAMGVGLGIQLGIHWEVWARGMKDRSMAHLSKKEKDV